MLPRQKAEPLPMPSSFFGMDNCSAETKDTFRIVVRQRAAAAFTLLSDNTKKILVNFRKIWYNGKGKNFRKKGKR